MSFPWSPELAAVDEKRRAEVTTALEACAGNVKRTAEQLGIARSYLNRLLERFELVERAKELKLSAGQRLTGRPKLR